MELDITQDVLKIKHRVINDLDGTADFYKSYHHVDGNFSISEQLLNQCMQAAYEAGYAKAEYEHRQSQW